MCAQLRTAQGSSGWRGREGHPPRVYGRTWFGKVVPSARQPDRKADPTRHWSADQPVQNAPDTVLLRRNTPNVKLKLRQIAISARNPGVRAPPQTEDRPMYAPGPFQETRRDVMLGAMRNAQLATLVTPADGELHITHVPMTAASDGDDGLRLEAHLARANPHHRVLAARPPSVAIFHGPQAYVSPGWYASKAEHGKVVPTWNYIVVHAHGRLEAIDDQAWLEDQVRRVTARNEDGRPTPWSVDDSPRAYFEGMLRGIVGIRLQVDRLEGIWKMQQHRSDADRAGLIAGYAAETDPAARAVGDVMTALERSRR